MTSRCKIKHETSEMNEDEVEVLQGFTSFFSPTSVIDLTENGQLQNNSAKRREERRSRKQFQQAQAVSPAHNKSKRNEEIVAQGLPKKVKINTLPLQTKHPIRETKRVSPYVLNPDFYVFSSNDVRRSEEDDLMSASWTDLLDSVSVLFRPVKTFGEGEVVDEEEEEEERPRSPVDHEFLERIRTFNLSQPTTRTGSTFKSGMDIMK